MDVLKAYFWEYNAFAITIFIVLWPLCLSVKLHFPTFVPPYTIVSTAVTSAVYVHANMCVYCILYIYIYCCSTLPNKSNKSGGISVTLFLVGYRSVYISRLCGVTAAWNAKSAVVRPNLAL